MRQQIKIAVQCAAIALTAFLMLASFGWLMDGEPMIDERVGAVCGMMDEVRE